MSASAARLSRAAVDAEVLDRLHLQVGIAVPLGDVHQHFARLGRAALRQHEERARLSRGEPVPCSTFCSIGIASSEALLAQRVERDELHLLVALGGRVHRLAGVLLHFDFERLGVAQVAALRVVLDQDVDRRQRLGALSLLVLRVGLPVERGVRLRPLDLDHPVEGG